MIKSIYFHVLAVLVIFFFFLPLKFEWRNLMWNCFHLKHILQEFFFFPPSKSQTEEQQWCHQDILKTNVAFCHSALT